MAARKMVVFTLALLVAIAGSAAVWLFIWNDLPKKTPIRAKQVFQYDKHQQSTLLEVTNKLWKA